MSEKYPGGLITKTPVTPTGPYQTGAASGVWTRDQQLQYQKQGIWPTAGLTPNYIEDVFSTYLYNGTSATQTITNNIDLSGKGGLVWIKMRSAGYYPKLYDTSRGVNKALNTATDGAEATETNGITAFNSSGFTMGNSTYINDMSNIFASWTFREQPKFFDVVTFTTTGAATQTINHNLLSAPGCIVVKDIANAGTSWMVYHRAIDASAPQDYRIFLNLTSARNADNAWGNTAPTSTQFTVGGSISGTASTYVAYLFAHNAGGFGLTGTDNVITCGTFSTDSGGASTAPINLGYEPQWVMTKNSSGGSAWRMFDNMRGMPVGRYTALLQAQSYSDEITNTNYCNPTATGFTVAGHEGLADFIYIAIRRGPMATPTSGTSVFDIQQYTGTQSSNPGVARNITTTIRSDVNITSAKTPGFDIGVFFDRLRGCNKYIGSNSTNAEGTMPGSVAYEFWNNKYILGGYYLDYTGYQYVNYSLQRAPSFFDEVCYTGTGTSGQTNNHNLGVAPELIIFKERSAASSLGWPTVFGFSSTTITFQGLLNDTGATYQSSNVTYTSSSFIKAQPTSTLITIGDYSDVNSSGQTYVAYLFATCPGVSKVGSYTGTGTLTTINCGFTGGARFVLIKRTNSTGDWYVWDTSRGMVSGTDPSLSLNTTSAESNANSVYTVTTGFQLLASPSADVNTSGGTYIYLAIA